MGTCITTIDAGDPGYAIMYSDAASVHQCLGLAAVTAGLPMPHGVPVLQQGKFH